METKIYRRGIANLVKAFQDREFDAEFMWDYLKDLNDEDFIRAIDQVIMNTKEVNKATNLIALIRLHATKETRYLAEEAWTDVLREARRVGAAGSPVFENEAARRSMLVIGWMTICLSEDLSYDRTVFIRAYNNFIEQDMKQGSMKITDDRIKAICGGVLNGKV